MRAHSYQDSLVLKPLRRSAITEEIRICWSRQGSIVGDGGDTGEPKGVSAIHDPESSLSISRPKCNPSYFYLGILVADAGCILESLSDHIAPYNHIMPLDLGAKGSCQIGGNLSTNAGGLRLLRYGSLHGTVLGLEVVLPDGTVLDQLSTLRKDNTGYDLKQLFIGGEGTLGVITGVSILTPPAPQASNNIFLALPHFKNVLPLFQTVKRQLGEILSAFEYIDRTAYDMGLDHGLGPILNPDEVGDAQCFILAETSGGNQEHDLEASISKCKLNNLLESLMSADEPLIYTGTLSQSPGQFASLWALREGLTECVQKEGKPYKYDVSVPLAEFQSVVDAIRERLISKGLYGDHAISKVMGYGHVGDGEWNLHLNVIAKHGYRPELEAALEPFIYELVASHTGSVSAEHGIGSMKTDALRYSKSDVSIEWMRKIKRVFDPLNIMNPGKVLPS
ncbi:hypothetical protein J3R82DRAFT_930, partial [Butyriboletus roseoflavus]